MAKHFNAGLTSTYRLQLHKRFAFADAARQADYLRSLGVSHAYASPILRAGAGSMHGYDVTDFNCVNPELGGEAGFRAFAEALRAQGVGLIVDIVPNHMAVGGQDNPYWLDLLEKGRDSAYADFFDVDFDQPGAEGKILAPFLGASYAETLAKGELTLRRRGESDGFAVYHHDHCFPIRDVDQQTIRSVGLDEMNRPDRLHALLEAQHYRLAGWRAANDLINYRRFFEITTLAGVRIERPQAFEKMHRIALQLYAEGLIDGVRVDHVDGLTDPAGYCAQLRTALDARRGERPEDRRDEAYIVVEKILAGDEALPHWPIEGTTGYDFMNEVSALQHQQAGAETLDAYWSELAPATSRFETVESEARCELLGRNFASQLNALVSLAHRWGVRTTGDRDLTRGAIERAVTAIVKHLRVYRSYALGGPGNPGAGAHWERAYAAASQEATRDDQALQVLRDLMNAKDESRSAAEAIRRFHQLTAPVAAKAVEDTAFYRYGRALSRNDVGFDAARLGMEMSEFHHRMTARAQDWPHAMLTTATHDHKRGEDVRARLATLSEIPDRWVAACREWRAMSAELRKDRLGAGEEYMLFQMIVGAWPVSLKPTDPEGLRAYGERLAGWQQKALREAKLRSSWLTPNVEYEEQASAYLRDLLDPSLSAAFLVSAARFVADIASAGVANSLTQVALRCLAPGLPDLYQGSELWDLTLVDPDNRRPVDFDLRRRLLSHPAEGLDARASGAVKQALIRTLLTLRREEAELFAFADYRGVSVDAPLDVFAFERRHAGKAIFAALLLHAGAVLYGGERLTPAADVWNGATLPFDPTGWRQICGGAADDGEAALARVFAESPVAVWLKS